VWTLYVVWSVVESYDKGANIKSLGDGMIGKRCHGKSKLGIKHQFVMRKEIEIPVNGEYAMVSPLA